MNNETVSVRLMNEMDNFTYKNIILLLSREFLYVYQRINTRVVDAVLGV